MGFLSVHLLYAFSGIINKRNFMAIIMLSVDVMIDHRDILKKYHFLSLSLSRSISLSVLSIFSMFSF